MLKEDHYKTPQSVVDKPVELDEKSRRRIVRMTQGQKYVIYALLLYLSGQGLALFMPRTSSLITLYLIVLAVVFALSVVGVVAILIARQSHILIKVALFLLLFIPLINILILISINIRATRDLREVGYKVGFLGVKGLSTTFKQSSGE